MHLCVAERDRKGPTGDGFGKARDIGVASAAVARTIARLRAVHYATPRR